MQPTTLRPKIIIDENIPFIKGQAERLGECIYAKGSELTPTLVADADMLIIRTRTHCNEDLLGQSKIKYIVTATIGFDHIDTDFLAKKNIQWTNCPGCNAHGVAQYVHTVLLKAKADGILSCPSPVIGIVGVGNVGRSVSQWLQKKGYRVLLNDSPLQAQGKQGFVELQTLAEQCDVISFHTPLTHKGEWATYHLADETFFAQCAERSPFIINAARGGVMDEQAALKALYNHDICGLAVDTWENEPHINTELLEKAYIATPHIAGYSADGKAKATQMALEAAANFLQQDIQFQITPPAFPATAQYHPYLHPSCEALRLYDPTVDSIALKRFPALFEQIRGHYPLRCEEAL